MQNLVFRVIILFSITSYCKCDCGTPGISTWAVIFDKPEGGSVYKIGSKSSENSVIYYSCYDRSVLTKYGFIRNLPKRICRKGQWTGQIPKCARNVMDGTTLMLTKIVETDLETNYSNTINFTEKQNWMFYPYKKLKLDINAKSNQFRWDFHYDLQVIAEHLNIWIEIFDSQFNGTIDLKANVGTFRKCHTEYKRRGYGDKFKNQEMGITCTVDSNDMLQMEKITINSSKLFSLEYKSDFYVNFTITSIVVYRLSYQCGRPDIPLNTHVEQYSYFSSFPDQTIDAFPQTVTFRPEPGHRIEGDTQLYCDWNGEWSSKPPIVVPETTCKIPSKSNLSSILNYKLKNYEYSNMSLVATIGTSITFDCANESMQLIGRKVQFCGESGEWDSSVPLCKELNYSNETRTNNNGENSTHFIAIIIIMASLLITIIIIGAIFIALFYRKKEGSHTKRETFYQDTELSHGMFTKEPFEQTNHYVSISEYDVVNNYEGIDVTYTIENGADYLQIE